ncbi:hypothetical protein Bbelb_384290, partial [Branchiostoma belcheri]
EGLSRCHWIRCPTAREFPRGVVTGHLTRRKHRERFADPLSVMQQCTCADKLKSGIPLWRPGEAAPRLPGTAGALPSACAGLVGLEREQNKFPTTGCDPVGVGHPEEDLALGEGKATTWLP